ncbi:hypothetical protein JNJ66_07035 [Candidatus Saccharibacteria bacterium]|nr:hypothetical protein [Candidatus Saccharibacteria bacterium]
MKQFFKKLTLYVVAAVSAVTMVPLSEVHAQVVTPQPLSLEEYKREIQSNYYDELDLNAPCSAQVGTTVLVGGDNVEMAWNFFIQNGLSPQQAAGIMGNLMVESHLVPDKQEVGQPWPRGGWGIAQWTGARRPPLAAAVQAAGLPYTNAQTPANQITPLLALQLDYLKNESISRKSITRPGAANEWEGIKQETTVEAAMIYWEKNFERAGKPMLGRRLDYANQIFAKYGNKAPAGQPTTPNPADPGEDPGTNVNPNDPGVANPTNGTGCSPSTGGGVVAGNIVKTALGLAWPQPFKHAQPDPFRRSAMVPTPAYKTELAKYGYRGDGADCGVFVSTVMRSSGADPKFPVGTANIKAYMESHPELYKNMGPLTSTDQLVPGDIPVIPSTGGRAGHIFLYVGPQPGNYSTASASLDSRTASLTNDNINDSRGRYTIFRPVMGGAAQTQTTTGAPTP